MTSPSPSPTKKLRDPVDEPGAGPAPAAAPLTAVAGMHDAGRAPFPRSREEFDADDRVAFSKADDKWILEDEAGETWEWHQERAVWALVIDENDMLLQQQAYAVAGESEEIADPREKRKELKQQKKQQGAEKDGKSSVSKKRSRGDDDPKPRKSTAVYITGLTPETTEADLNEVFQKYGFIAMSEANEPRIKLYRNEDGSLKGDALVIYAFPQSVQLAIQMMDEAPFEPSSLKPGSTGPPIRVSEADTSFKKVKSEGAEEGAGAEKQQKPRLTEQQKQRLEAQKRKIANKLADWSDDEYPLEKARPKWSNNVILKRMFTLNEIEGDPAIVFEIKEDIRDECAKLGTVTNLTLYDAEAEGIVKVRFSADESGYEAAERCVKMMDGRSFDGRVVSAKIWDGHSRYRKAEAADDDEEDERLDKFGNWLEGGGEP